MTNADFYIKQGNVEPALEVTLRGQDGEPINLTSAIVRFQMSKVGADALAVDDHARFVDPENGVVAYEWDDGDTDEPGSYLAEFQVDYDASGTFEADEEFPKKGYISVLIVQTLD